MTWMFYKSSSLTTIEVDDKWSTSSVKQSEAMFYGDAKLVGSMGTKYDAGHIDHEYAQIDGGLCDPGYLSGEYKGLNTPYVVFVDKTITFYYDHMMNCREGEVYPIKETYSYQDLPDWQLNDYSQVVFDKSFAGYHPTSTAYWFFGDSKYHQSFTSIKDIHYLVTDQVVNMERMFYDCIGLGSLNLTTFDTSMVINMHEMFYGCRGLKNLDVTSFNTSKVLDMGGMFWGCSGLTTLDVTHFDTSNVEEMGIIFADCAKLTTLDVTHFNTSKVLNMSNVFTNCSSLKSIDVTKFDTSNARSMYLMFDGCSSLTELDVTNFNTSKVENMSCMFRNCKQLISLDLSSFDTGSVIAVEGMFANCGNLRTIYVGDKWDDSSISLATSMFSDCPKLVGGKGTKFDSTHINGTYAHIDGGTSDPGYLTCNNGTIKKGDANCDGKVDILDISAMGNLITQDKYNDRVDMNKDGKVNATDLVFLVNILK